MRDGEDRAEKKGIVDVPTRIQSGRNGTLRGLHLNARIG